MIHVGVAVATARLSEKAPPSEKNITLFRASQNTNRWRIIDTMFAKSQPLDARVMFFR